jgi:hypothetical protein
MALPESLRIIYLDRYNKKVEQLTALYLTYDKLNDEYANYKFDSGQGKQETTYKTLKELSDQIRILESDIEFLYKKLNCQGITYISLRRKD